MRYSPTRTCKTCTEFTAERLHGRNAVYEYWEKKKEKVTSISHSLLIINPSSWWSEILVWCRTKGQGLFNLHANYLRATVVTAKSPMGLSLTLVFLAPSNTDLKNVISLFHIGRACSLVFFFFLMGSLLSLSFSPSYLWCGSNSWWHLPELSVGILLQDKCAVKKESLLKQWT